MFSRRSSLVFESLSAETKRIGVRHSAQSKKNRVQVQLLQNTPGYGYRGEVVTVKPSVALDILTPRNQGYFLLKGQTPRIPVVQRVKRNIAPKKVVEVQSQAPNQFYEAPQVTTPEGQVSQSSPIETKAEPKPTATLMSLEDLLNVNAADKVSENRKTIIEAMPTNFTLADSVVRSLKKEPLTPQRLAENIASRVARDLPRFLSPFSYVRSVSSTLFDSEGKEIKSIEVKGSYTLKLTNSQGEVERVCEVTV